MAGKRIVQDPERFARMYQPHESKEAAEEALDAFFDDVSVAREKHRIAEVVLLTGVVRPDEDGEPSLSGGCSSLGSDHQRDELIAWAYGALVAPKARKLLDLAAGKRDE